MPVVELRTAPLSCPKAMTIARTPTLSILERLLYGVADGSRRCYYVSIKARIIILPSRLVPRGVPRALPVRPHHINQMKLFEITMRKPRPYADSI